MVTKAVLVSLVTWNSAVELPSCLASLRRQTWPDFEVRVWDNASADGTIAILAENAAMFAGTVLSPVNRGYSAAHNQNVSRSTTEFVLCLNPDTVLAPDFLARAVAALGRHPECGSLSPKLCRLSYGQALNLTRDEPGPDGGPPESLACVEPELTNQLDSAGIFWTRNQRHFDRGGGEPDRSQFDRPEYVFGVTGAAAFYRRACLDDVAVAGEILDEDFFAYREDVDLAWRAAWRGWRCLYRPDVLAWHARKVLPEGRRRYPAAVNRHSVRNRFLLRLKNMPLATWARFCLPITARDLGILLYLPFGEPSSLPALWEVLRLTPRFLAKRRQVLGTATVARRQMEQWFSVDAQPLVR